MQRQSVPSLLQQWTLSVQPTCTPRTGPAPWAAPHIDLLCHLKITFEELCQKWLDSRHDVREVTQIGYQQALKPVRAQIGRTKVQDLTRSRIENVIISLREERGLSHRSIVYTLRVIKQILA